MRDDDVEDNVSRFPAPIDDASFEAERRFLAPLRQARVPAHVLEGFTERLLAAVAETRPEAVRRRLGGGLLRAAAVIGIGLLLSFLAARFKPAHTPPVDLAQHTSVPGPGLVAMASPVSELFVDADTQVVFVVLPGDEEL